VNSKFPNNFVIFLKKMLHMLYQQNVEM
jgi:hypothetical protein